MEPSKPPTGKRNQNPTFWIYAASFGALWGTVEGVLGVFLHALKIPMVGLILATISVIILSVQRRLCPLPGISLATGLVAASIRALAPSTVVWGPLLGISMEAALFDLMASLIPWQLPGIALGGAVALLWSFSQGIITKLLLYGQTLVDLLLSTLSYIVDLFGIQPAHVHWVAVASAALIMGIGATAAFAGIRIARSLPWIPSRTLPSWDSRGSPHADLEPQQLKEPPPSSSPMLDQLILISLLAFPVLHLTFSWAHALAPVIIMLALLVLQNPNAAKRLFRPSFWIATLVITLGAGLMLGPKGQHNETWLGLSLSGLVAGAQMLVRALYLVGLMTWLGRLAARPGPRALMARIFPPGLVDAVSAAADTLPAFTQVISRNYQEGTGSRLTRTLSLLSRRRLANLLNHAHQLALARILSTISPPRIPMVIIVTAPTDAGKTTWLQNLVGAMRLRGRSVGGIIQPKRRRSRLPSRPANELAQAGATHPLIPKETAPTDHGYDAQCLETGAIQKLASPRRNPRSYEMRFRFRQRTFDWARPKIIRAATNSHVLVVDEFGHLEAQGLGYTQALVQSMALNRADCWLLCAKKERVDLLEKLLSPWPVVIINLDPSATPPEAP